MLSTNGFLCNSCISSCITGTKTPCSNLYYWICCCHGSTVSGIGVTSHWILCKSNSMLNSLKVIFVKKVSVLQLPYLGVKFTQLAGLLWAGGSLILFGYTYIVATIILMYTHANYSICQYRQVFITVTVCKSHMVSTPAIWTVCLQPSVVKTTVFL